MERLIEKLASVFLIAFIAISLYGQFHYLLPWHVEPLETHDITGTHVIVNWYETEEINAEFDITTTSIMMHWFDTEKELRIEVQRLEDEYCEENEIKCVDYSDVAALTECDWRPEVNHSFCEMWLVRPTQLDEWTFDKENDKWLVLGHEFYHVGAGLYHYQKEYADD